MLTVGSLFSGIGGLDLGLERAGMQVIWQSEIDNYASRVLKKHWPEVPNYGDIKAINWGDVVRPDVLCGGYPCQPFSTAGKRKGEEDPRHLWPWVRQAISELRPRYAILENVRGHLSLGGTTVIGEITALGYDCEWRVVSAASVGANHRRDRIIIVAYPNGTNERQQKRGVGEWKASGWAEGGGANANRRGTNVANPNRGDTTNGRQRETLPSEDRCWGNDTRGSRSDTWQTSMGSSGQDTSDVAYPNNSRERTPKRNLQREGTQGVYNGVYAFAQSRRHGDYAEQIAQWWQTEPNVGRVADGIPARVDRLKGLGNAVVPQVAEIIGRLVVAHAQHN